MKEIIKRKKKCFLSCYNQQKGMYKNKIDRAYDLIFVDSIPEADYIIIPREPEGLSAQQLADYDEAERLDKDGCILNGELIILNLMDEKFDNGLVAKEKEESLDNNLVEEKEYGLEL